MENLARLKLDCGNHVEYVYSIPKEEDRVIAMKNEVLGLLTALERSRQNEYLEVATDFLLNGTDCEYVPSPNEPKVKAPIQRPKAVSDSSSAVPNTPGPSSAGSSCYFTVYEEMEKEEVFYEASGEINMELIERIRSAYAAEGNTVLEERASFIMSSEKL